MMRSLVFLLCVAFGSTAHADDAVSFRKDVAPILLDNCLACHGPKKAEGGYRVDTYARAIAEGDSFAAGFTAEDVDNSEAFRRIASEDPDERMPLDGDPLPAEQVALIKKWIEQGAKFDGEDAETPLAALIPPPEHPPAPEAYPNTMPITALAFSPDGQQLLVGGYHELTVWNPADGQLIRRIGNVGQRTYALTYSPDGNQLAVACGAPGRLGEVRLLDSATGEVTAVLCSTSDVVLDVAFNPAGDRLAVASADASIRIYEAASGTQQLSITSHSDWVMAVAWNADGTKLASASRDKTAKVFDAQTGELAVTYSGHNESVKGVAFAPGGEEVFSSGSDRKVHRWKIADGKKSAEMATGGEAFKLRLAGEHLYAPSADKTVRQLNPADNKEVRRYSGHQDWVLEVAIHAESKRLASGSFDGEVRVWNIEDGKPVTTFVAAPGYGGETK